MVIRLAADEPERPTKKIRLPDEGRAGPAVDSGEKADDALREYLAAQKAAKAAYMRDYRARKKVKR